MYHDKNILNRLLTCMIIASFMLLLAPPQFALAEDSAEYEPTDVIISEGKTSGCISWRNPEADTITGVSLYDSRTNKLIDSSFTTLRGEACRKIFSGLSASEIKKCRLEFEFSDHEKTSVAAEIRAKASDDANLNDTPFENWSLAYYDSSYRYIPTKIFADSSQAHSGNYSMHIVSNKSSQNTPNEWMKIIGAGKENWDTSKKYRITMYKKSRKAENDTIYFQYDAEWNKRIQLTWGNDYTEWTKVSQVLSPSKTLSNGFAVFVVNPGVIQDFWLDDITIYELDAAGNEIGDNLMLNGDFESLRTAPGEFEYVTAEGKNECAELSWHTNETIDKINIYEKNGDALTLRAVADGTGSSFVMPGLENGREYFYEVKPVNRFNIEGTGMDISVIPMKTGGEEPGGGEEESDSEFIPSNVIVSGDGGAICVSWRNPAADTLTKVSLYDNAENTLIADDFGTSSDEVCSKTFTDVKTGEIRKYRLEFEFSNHSPISLPLDGKADAALRKSPFVNWSVNYYSSAYGHVPVSISADGAEKYSGNYSMHITSNHISSDDNLGIKIVGKGSSALVSGKKYRVTMYKKGRKTTSDKLYFRNDSLWENRIQLTWGNDYPEWTKVTKDITATSALSGGFAVFFVIPKAVKDFWIDDITVYELDNDGNEIGDNLILNGGFEEISDEYPPQDVADCKASASDSTVDISWSEKPFTESVRVYKKNGKSSLELMGIVRQGECIKLENLANGVKHTFVIKAVNAAGLESDGVEVTAMPKEDLLKITNFRFYENGREITSVLSGNITAKVTVKNNDSRELSSMLILALYDDKLMTASKAVSVTVKPQSSRELSAELTVADVSEGDYTVKAFLWDSPDSMLIQIPSKTLNK